MSKICFTHNVHCREKTLKRTMAIENEFFPDSVFCIANDGNEFGFEESWKVDFKTYGPPQGHKVGCYNGVLVALGLAVKYEADIISFSHDDVYICNIDKVREGIKLIESGYDFVGRRHRGGHSHTKETSPKYNDCYIMLECFMMTKKLAQKITAKSSLLPAQGDHLLPLDIRGSHSPELAFGKLVRSTAVNPYFIDFDWNYQDRENEMGYYHIKNIRGWKE